MLRSVEVWGLTLARCTSPQLDCLGALWVGSVVLVFGAFPSWMAILRLPPISNAVLRPFGRPSPKEA